MANLRETNLRENRARKVLGKRIALGGLGLFAALFVASCLWHIIPVVFREPQSKSTATSPCTKACQELREELEVARKAVMILPSSQSPRPGFSEAFARTLSARFSDKDPSGGQCSSSARDQDTLAALLRLRREYEAILRRVDADFARAHQSARPLLDP